MATLSGNKIKNTYQSLVKFSDNGNITTSAKRLTDGFGNNSPMWVSTTQVGIGVTPESGLNLHVYGDAKIGSNLTVIGNLVVEGSTTTVGTDTLTVKDPLIVLANNNTSTDAVDIGFYGKYTPSGTTLYSGLFREALTGKYRLFKDLEDEPTTTVNTSGTGYAQATLIAALEGDVTGNITGNVTGNVTGDLTGDVTGNVTGNLTGNVTGGTISGTTGTFSGNVDIDGTLDVDDVISVEGSDFGRIEVGGASGGYIDLKAPNSDDYDFRLITSTGGAELYSIDTLKFYTGATTDLAFTIDASQNATFENNVTIPETPTADTHAASKGYVDAAVEGQDTLAEILAGGNTTGGTDIAVSTGDDITFVTDSKAIFGDNNGLQLYDDGTDSYIDSTGGELKIRANDLRLLSYGSQKYITADLSSDVSLYYNNSKKFETTDTGVSVTGNINLADNNKILLGDGDDVEMYWDSNGVFAIDVAPLQQGMLITSNTLRASSGTHTYIDFNQAELEFFSLGNEKFKVHQTGVTVSGDLTVDLNTLFVDASANSVGINLTNPSDYTADELVISVPDGSGMTLVSGSTDAAYITFMSSTGAIATNGGYVSYNHDTDTLQNFAQSKVSIAILEAEVAYFTDTAFFVDKNTTIEGSVTIDSSTATLNLTGSNTGASLINFADSDDGNVGRIYYDHTDNFMQFKTNDSESLRIDSSGNVGIGEADPSGYWGQANDIVIDTSGNGGMTIKSTTNGNGRLVFTDTKSATAGNTDGGMITYNHTDDEMRFQTNGSQKMVIDSSGNVGIGTTSPDRILHINSSNVQIAALIESTNTTSTQLNFKNGSTTNNGGFIKTTGDNIILTANNTSATHLVVASGGDVGIGTTSPSTKLQVKDSQDSSFDSGISVIRSASSQTGYINMVGGAFNFNAPSGVPIRFRDGGTANVTIDGSGNVGIGTTTPTESLNCIGNIHLASVYNATGITDAYLYLQTRQSGNWRNAYVGQTGNNLVFGTGGTGTTHTNATERMRIDSSGNVLVQATSIGGNGLSIRPNATAGTVQQVFNRASTTSDSYIFDFQNGGTTVGYIRYNNTTTTYATSSDYRLKENVVEMTGALDRVSQLKPSRFNFISDADTTVDGFLAHEVQEIVPEAISGEKDAVDEEGNPEYQGIDQSKLVPLLVGAIQELQKRIEILENK